MPLLTAGNSAKLYCLNWIEQYVQQRSTPIRILDLGSGTSGNFINLLQQYPHVHYTGIEPSAAAVNVAKETLPRANSTLINDYAYDIMGRLVHEPFDILVSFSVLEHVVQRQNYLSSGAACMHDDSHFLINYDAGHFVMPASLKEQIKNVVGPLFTLFGIERYYQRFVKEEDFQQMVKTAGLTIEEAKSFNTTLKGIHKVIPESERETHMQRWLDYELWLNEIGTPYNDSLARYWVTRNFILSKKRM